jgi:IS5 family transposase
MFVNESGQYQMTRTQLRLAEEAPEGVGTTVAARTLKHANVYHETVHHGTVYRGLRAEAPLRFSRAESGLT